jgi:hypothetical protein
VPDSAADVQQIINFAGYGNCVSSQEGIRCKPAAMFENQRIILTV